MENIESQLQCEMVHLYERALKEVGYKATYLLQLINSIGGLAAAKKLINSKDYPEGLTNLWELKRLDLSMEALIINEPWSKLFTSQELNIARIRLKELQYIK